jgi:hypothetical protein
MRLKLLLLLLAAFAMCASQAYACNQTIPSGDSCIHGSTSGANGNNGNALICPIWDTYPCTAPFATVYSFNSGAFEFILPAGSSVIIAVEYPSGGGTPVYDWFSPTSVSVNNVVSGQTYYVSFSSGCTDYGYYIGYC